jgi:CheY-like chemotaxis protein
MANDPVVLQVEDDDASHFVFRQLFEEICPDLCLQRAKNGAEALTMIQDLAGDPAMRLALVLLDVFLPLVDGWEVLASMRAIESLRQIPVVMLTGQIIERDQERCAALGVEYIQKPSELRTLVLLIKEICNKAAAATA